MNIAVAERSWGEVEALCHARAEENAYALASLAQGVVIFGAGYHGHLALALLQQRGAAVRCFADNDPNKAGRTILGVPVVTVAALATEPPALTFIAARHAVPAVERQLIALGLRCLSVDAFFVLNSLDRLRHCRNCLLDDDRSRLVFDGILKAMLTGRKSFCAEVMDTDQYFVLPPFIATGNEHLIDAGAYVGDTIERFLWAHNGAFARIHAFEPGRTQFAAMQRRLERLTAEWALPEGHVVCNPMGLGEQNANLSFNAGSGVLQNASFSATAVDADTVPVVALDAYLAGRPATFIKADVEGMEMALLRGARKTIEEQRPKLAISVYHDFDHLFTVAEYVKSLVPSYRMAVRHHAPVLMETVLYCWIEE